MRVVRVIGLTCAGLLAAGAGFYGWGRMDASTAQTAAPPPPTVTVANPLVREVTDYDEFTGRFEPTAMVEVRPRVSGYLTEINFKDGQIVEAGQALFVIDKRPYQTALAQAEAQLAGATAQLAFAEADAKRSQELVKSSNIAVATHEQRIQQRQAADAARKTAEAAVARARLDLEFTEVRSPVRGPLLVFLLLAAQYESWTLPLAIILIVPMCLLAAVTGLTIRGMPVDILAQAGFVVLIGLAAKNAILIVEFARQNEDRGIGRAKAAIDAVKTRLRPILMTSLAFILGVVPLALATGAGAEMRQSLGTAVFYGMIGVTIFGLIFTPVFYVVCRALARDGKADGKAKPGLEPETPALAPGE